MKEQLEMEVGYTEQSVRFNKYSSKTRIPIFGGNWEGKLS